MLRGTPLTTFKRERMQAKARRVTFVMFMVSEEWL
jgi:hypothetical protein